jgi:hypothetical protein
MASSPQGPPSVSHPFSSPPDLGTTEHDKADELKDVFRSKLDPISLYHSKGVMSSFTDKLAELAQPSQPFHHLMQASFKDLDSDR